eukprot:4836528-Prymnesium_polylepis.2
MECRRLAVGVRGEVLDLEPVSPPTRHREIGHDAGLIASGARRKALAMPHDLSDKPGVFAIGSERLGEAASSDGELARVQLLLARRLRRRRRRRLLHCPCPS